MHYSVFLGSDDVCGLTKVPTNAHFSLEESVCLGVVIAERGAVISVQ
jgi:hypothetical protein